MYVPSVLDAEARHPDAVPRELRGGLGDQELGQSPCVH